MLVELNGKTVKMTTALEVKMKSRNFQEPYKSAPKKTQWEKQIAVLQELALSIGNPDEWPEASI